ncbi:hypothetical protein ACFQHZ_07100 [Marivibrio halodurans]
MHQSEGSNIRFSSGDRASLERTARALDTTTDISGFEPILKGAVDRDPSATLSEVDFLRTAMTDESNRAHLDHMLDRIMRHTTPTATPRRAGRARAHVASTSTEGEDHSSRTLAPGDPVEAVRRGWARKAVPNNWVARNKKTDDLHPLDPETGKVIVGLDDMPLRLRADGLEPTTATEDAFRALKEGQDLVRAMARGVDGEGAIGIRDREALREQVANRYARLPAVRGTLEEALRFLDDDRPESRAYAKQVLERASQMIADPALLGRDIANRRFAEHLGTKEMRDAGERRLALTERKRARQSSIVGTLVRFDNIIRDIPSDAPSRDARVEAAREELWARIAPAIDDYALVNSALLEVPRPPYPEQDEAAAFATGLHAEEHLAMRRTLADLGVGAITGAGVAGAAWKLGRGAAGLLGLGATAVDIARSSAERQSALSNELFERASREGVDIADPDAVTAYIKDRPELGRALSRKLLTGLATDVVSGELGGWLGRRLSERLGGGRVSDHIYSQAAEKVLKNAVFEDEPE